MEDSCSFTGYVALIIECATFDTKKNISFLNFGTDTKIIRE